MALTRITDKQVTYKQGATGSTVRNLGDKLRESVSVLDFGAIGDGVTDDTAAIKSALVEHNSVYLPAGTYKITSQISLSSGKRLCGDGATNTYVKCISSGFSGVFIRMAGGNNLIQGMSIEGDSTTQGTGIRISALNEYEFTGWMTLRDVHIHGINVGLDMNSCFSVLVDNCRIYSNYRGVRIVPSYDGIGDNGYFTTVTLNKCYINGNDDYGLLVSANITSRNLVLRDTVIEANTGTSSAFQASITKVSLLLIENCYFESVPAIPAVVFSECETVVSCVYVNGTGGFNFGTRSNLVNITRYYGTSTTDVIYANGTALQTVSITDSTIQGTSTLTATSLKLTNSNINGIFYRQYSSNLGLTVTDGDLANTSRVDSILALKRTISTTVPANTSVRIVSDVYLAGGWDSDFTVGIASFSNIDAAGFTLTVGPASTGSPAYTNVFMYNYTASPIVLTGALLKIMLFKGVAMAI